MSEQFKMNAELKAKWVKALRGGEYRQSKFALKDSQGYCCLGVLAEVAGIEMASYNSAVAYEQIRCLIGGEENKADYSVTSPYVEMNDAKDKSFAEIADYVEANL